MPSWTLEQLQQAMAAMIDQGQPGDPRAHKRERILRAATQLFTRQGYRKTSIDEIARRAGIAKGTLYLYFKNKAELLMHAVAIEKRVYLERMQPILDAPLAPRERLRRYLRTAIAVAAEMPLASRLMAGDDELAAVMADLEPALRERLNGMRLRFLGQLIADAAAPRRLDAQQLASRTTVLVSVLHRVPLFDAELRGGLPLERYAEALADVLIDGICCARPRKRGADHG